VSIDAKSGDPAEAIREKTGGRGVDVALELVGLPLTMRQSVRCLATQGRAAMVGITEKEFAVSAYHDLINREAEIIGVSDHLAAEIPLLLEFARTGKLDFAKVVTSTVPLVAKAINDVLDRLERFSDDVRVVVNP
jgi:threonine dehydrogenase-like Zn-dependent dehydrogenase